MYHLLIQTAGGIWLSNAFGKSKINTVITIPRSNSIPLEWYLACQGKNACDKQEPSFSGGI